MNYVIAFCGIIAIIFSVKNDFVILLSTNAPRNPCKLFLETYMDCDSNISQIGSCRSCFFLFWQILLSFFVSFPFFYYYYSYLFLLVQFFCAPRFVGKTNSLCFEGLCLLSFFNWEYQQLYHLDSNSRLESNKKKIGLYPFLSSLHCIYFREREQKILQFCAWNFYATLFRTTLQRISSFSLR